MAVSLKCFISGYMLCGLLQNYNNFGDYCENDTFFDKKIVPCFVFVIVCFKIELWGGVKCVNLYCKNVCTQLQNNP